MDNQSSVLLIGAGLASTSLALALLDKGYQSNITILEKNKDISNQKTWCFWGLNTLPEYLKPLVKKHWKSWQISDQERALEQVSSQINSDYCCIQAEDFYQFASEQFSKANNLKLLFDQDCVTLNPQNGQVIVEHNKQISSAKYGFDSSADLPNALEDGLYQCFTGAWITLSTPFFDADRAGLMLNLKTQNNAIQFTYTLPFSRTEGLWELTYFSTEVEDLVELKQLTKLALDKQFGENAYEITRWEQGVLPMSTAASKKPSVSHHGWHKIGTAGGMMRAATGYAFLPVQRWSQLAADAVIANKDAGIKNTIPAKYVHLDTIFLNVLRNQPELAPQIFMRMLERTNSLQFTKFMTERASNYDILNVIRAMPKLPFIKALF